MKQLDRNGLQGNKEFLGEVKALSLLTHENLVKFNGYCADGDQRILVYEYMPGGSLEDCLFGMNSHSQPKLQFSKISSTQTCHDFKIWQTQKPNGSQWIGLFA